ncbi:hypothetical protein AB0M95_38555, partial [Sphaerisporangium sp. NPDC051017]|uniref:DUF7224 domain-containing protein n=1 Tax=Sphaerisporangium sp. NPDC051017 TaxID=3154636 RepID=UPI0034224CC7
YASAAYTWVQNASRSVRRDALRTCFHRLRPPQSVQFIEARVGPEITAKAREVMRRPVSAQLRWFRENMKILDVCDVKPVDVK